MDKRLLDILTNKPELINNFPDWMLSPKDIEEIRKSKNSAIAEIAGRDSIAAVIRACEINDIRIIIPTIAYTGTEYGRWDITFDKVNQLKKRLEKSGISVYNPILLGSPKLWWQICGRYSLIMFKRYGFYSHCVGCHLYFHAIRIPLAKKLNCKVIIGGERELHDGKIKVNQISVALDAYIDFLKKYDIELLLPLRYISSGKEIEEIINEQWQEGEDQLSCVLSKNYQDKDGESLYSEGAIKDYLYEVAFDTAKKYLNDFMN
jgi:hypothetical protein